MIESINIDYYINNNKLIIHTINVQYENNKRITISFNYKNNKEIEIKRMKNILSRCIKKIIIQKQTSLENLLCSDTVKLTNIEVEELYENLNLSDKIHYRNSVLINLLILLGNIPGLLGFSSYSIGTILCFTNTLSFDKKIKENTKRIKKVYKKYDVDNKLFNIKRRKQLFNICLSINLILGLFTMINKTNEYKSNISIETKTPFSEENVKDLSDEEIKKYLVNCIDCNINLSKEDKNICKSICTYALDSEYIDLEELYKDLSALVIYNDYELKMDGKYKVTAEYFEEDNEIKIYDNNCDRSSIIQHETIHSTGRLKIRFLNEGITSLLQREYYQDNKETDGYTRNVNTIRLLCELVGSDTILQAFNSRNDDLLYESLSQIYADVDYAKKTLRTIDRIGEYSKYCSGDLLIELCDELLVNLDPYITNAKGVDKSNLYYYIDAIIYDYDANDIYYFNKDKNKILKNKPTD